MCYNKLIRFLIHRKELFMAVCYKKLWKLLIDKNMNKTELRMASGITTTALAKLGRDENVNTEVLAKICKTLDCKIEDIMEMVDEA
jgi:DNA-binding Xre family transcriptional regulator